jgi:RsiW-degrading membrane proteinase PrsW (M82 family)
MSDRRDPVEAHEEREVDLYEISTWEVRTAFDRLSAGLYATFVHLARLSLVLLGLVILVAQLVFGAFVSVPVGVFTVLSVIPALVLAGYLRYADVTTSEPLSLLAATFILAVLFAGFAGVLNTLSDSVLTSLGLTAGALGFVVQVGTFFIVVGPVEETVKLLAVRLYAFHSSRFDAVVDGIVYGAVAGLGFATIENAIYIGGATREVADPLNLVVTGGAITSVRALAGPGHVIYSAFAGYYLGLAKFNPQRAGPIVVKGLLIAALIHAVYNSLAGVVPSLAGEFLGIPWFAAFLSFVVVYDGLLLVVLFRKLARYRRAYDRAHDNGLDDGHPVKLTEFDA